MLDRPVAPKQAHLVPSPSSGVIRNVFDFLYLNDNHQQALGKESAHSEAHLVSSPSSSVIHKAIISVFVPTVSVIVSIISHNGFIIFIAASILVIVNDSLVLDEGITTATVIVAVIIDDSLVLDYGVVSARVSSTVTIIIVDDGLIFNDCIPTLAAVPISTVSTTLIFIAAAAVEVVFELFLVSFPMLLCYRTKVSVNYFLRRAQGWQEPQRTYRLCGLRASTMLLQPIQPLRPQPRMPCCGSSSVELEFE